MVNITLYARGNLEDKSTLSSSKKGFPFLSSLGKKRITWALIWELPGYSLFPQTE